MKEVQTLIRMNEKIYILGLGSTIEQYKHNPNNITFGVNDIEAYIKAPVKHLVCVNSESCFTPERKSTILNSAPKTFHGVKYHTNEWANHNPIVMDCKTVYNGKTEIKHNISIDDPIIYSGLSSPFMAVQLAYKLYPEMKSIYIFGVDFTTHRNFSGQRLDKELSFWKWLLSQLTSKGIKIHIPQKSKLIDVL